ncbi:MAG: hypothetical protein KDC87_00335 [Planctomycetes bacterium]|nr:hypothetical protein [Planctomycetota bacterium]MCB9869811.1 hypothetical protein [Planctomycetota bacterium]
MFQLPKRSLLGLLLLLTAPLAAQSVYVPDNNAAAGGCNVIPFGNSTLSTTWANQRYQQIASAADLGNPAVAVICDLAFAPCGTTGAKFIRHFDTIEVVMAQTSATTLSNTFSANLVTNVQTVLSATNYDWHQESGAWNRLGLQKDYLYIAAQGANVVIQVTVTGARHLTTGTAGCHTGGNQRLYAYGYTGAPPAVATGTSLHAQKVEFLFQVSDLHQFGVGCAGTNGTPELSFTGSAQLGQSLSIDLSNGPAIRPLYFALATSYFDGGVDLQVIGAPGCLEYVPANAILLGGVTDSVGKYSLSATVPNLPSVVCFRLYAQYFPQDFGANSAGLTASNYGRILPGK